MHNSAFLCFSWAHFILLSIWFPKKRKRKNNEIETAAIWKTGSNSCHDQMTYPILIVNG